MFIIKVQHGDIILDRQFTAARSTTTTLCRLHRRIVKLETILSDVNIPRRIHFVKDVDGVVDAATVRETGIRIGRVAANEASWSSGSWLNHVD